MPIEANSDTIRPALIANPDTRFAISALDLKYRSYSVTGEMLMDKSTGELYFRRKEDGKLVSFSQDYKDIYDQALNFNVLKSRYPDFASPTSDEAYIVTANYDVGAMNGEENLSANDVLLLDTSNLPENFITFKVSKRTKGFVIKTATRSTDKAVVEYLTKEYNKLNSVSIAETANTKLQCRITVINLDNDDAVSFDCEAMVRLNEYSYVNLTSILFDTLASIGTDNFSIVVTVYGIDVFKIREMLTYIADNPSATSTTVFNEIGYADKNIFIPVINVTTYVDTAEDILCTDNCRITGAIDKITFNNLMMQINSSKNIPSFILSENQPDETVWYENAVWAERIVDIDPVGLSETRTKALQDVEFLAARVNMVGKSYTNISEDIRDLSSIYLERVNRSQNGGAG